MKTNSFIYFTVNLIFVQLLSLGDQYVNLFVYVMCGIGVLTLGLSHGAVDDMLYSKSKTIKRFNPKFILNYVAGVIVFSLICVVSVNLALALFLLVSAYHFGQSQFVEFSIKSMFVQKLFFFSWGALVLLFMFNTVNQDFINALQSYLGASSFLIHVIDYSSYYLISCFILFIGITIGLYINKTFNFEHILSEFVLLFIVYFSFYLLPSLVAFSLFFVFIHSMKAMFHEFEYFKSLKKSFNVTQFVKLFIPLTAISLVSIALLLIVLYQSGSIDLIPITAIILISSITMPHTIVMEKFYKGFLNK